MKLTNETIKQLIKEELEEMMGNQRMSRQERLEKIVMSSTAMLIVGMATIIYNLLIK